MSSVSPQPSSSRPSPESLKTAVLLLPTGDATYGRILVTTHSGHSASQLLAPRYHPLLKDLKEARDADKVKNPQAPADWGLRGFLQLTETLFLEKPAVHGYISQVNRLVYVELSQAGLEPERQPLIKTITLRGARLAVDLIIR